MIHNFDDDDDDDDQLNRSNDSDLHRSIPPEKRPRITTPIDDIFGPSDDENDDLGSRQSSKEVC